jgi:hypothetical protein
MSHRSNRVKRTTLAAAACLAITSLVGLTAVTPAAAAVCAGTAPSDFNGDGISDAAIGAAAPGFVGQGHVHVIYGSRHGLTADASGTALDDQLLTSPTDGLRGFGDAFATGDLNGDGCSDLAVGDVLAPDAAGHLAGAVRLYYGSTTGLQSPPFTLNEALSGGTVVRDNDRFGMALAMADFNGDGLSDLAVGAPYTDLGGEIFMYPGNRVFSPLLGARRLSEGDGTVPGVDEGGDRIGAAFATGDFNGDGHSDLAIGVPGENLDRGAVFVLPGNGSGSMFATTGSQVWTQDSTGILGVAQEGDEFGWSLSSGSFKGNGRTDLAVGVPFEGVNGHSEAGAVNVLYSAGTAGLTSAGNQLWTKDATGLAGGAAQTDADFGFSLAAGDFNGNGRADLAVGARGATVSGAAEAGSATVIAGTSTGLSATGSSNWNQATAGIGGGPETSDHFGNSLDAQRVTSAARDDLLFGASGDALTSATPGAGVAHLIPGSTGGLTATGSQLWSADTAGIRGSSCAACGFGEAVG